MVSMKFHYETNRIKATDDHGQLLAEITFPFRELDRVEIDHVFVTEECRGQGVASKLVELAYDYLKEQKYKADVTCPYAVSWFIRHPRNQDIVLNDLESEN